MNITERNTNDVVILDISGKLVLGEGDTQLIGTTREALTEGKKNLLFNLGDVTYVDSAGLGALISCYSSTAREGGRLKLLNLTRRIQDLLAITKLITVFEVYEDEQEAVESFA